MKKNPFKYDYYGYQNAIPIGNNQILFVEQNKDLKSSVSEISKTKPFSHEEALENNDTVKNDVALRSYDHANISNVLPGQNRLMGAIVEHTLNSIPKPKLQGKLSRKIKVVSFLSLEQMLDVFPSESTIVLENQ